MAAAQKLSIHCELAHFIYACTDECLVKLKWDRTDYYYCTGFQAGQEELCCVSYDMEEEFLDKLRFVLDDWNSDVWTFIESEYGSTHFRASPWVLEKLYHERGLQPPRDYIPAIERMHHQQMRALCVLNKDDEYDVFDAKLIDDYKAEFEEVFGRPPGCVFFAPDEQ